MVSDSFAAEGEVINSELYLITRGKWEFPG